jgi:hypothetical protein
MEGSKLRRTVREVSLRERLRENTIQIKELLRALKGKGRNDNQMRDANSALIARLREDRKILQDKYSRVRRRTE